MTIEIEYNGKTYKSRIFSPKEVEEVRELVYQIGDLTRFSMILEDGNELVIGEGVIRNCVFMLKN